MTNVLEQSDALIKVSEAGQIFRATVFATDGNQILIIRPGESTPDETSYPKIAGTVASPGDEVLVLRIGTAYLVVGAIVHNNRNAGGGGAVTHGVQILGLPAPGAGTPSDIVIDADTTFSEGVYFCNDFTLEAGVKLTIDRGTLILCEGHSQIDGEIDGDGYGGRANSAQPGEGYGGNIIPSIKAEQNPSSSTSSMYRFANAAIFRSISSPNYAYTEAAYASVLAARYGRGGYGGSTAGGNGLAGVDFDGTDPLFTASDFLALVRELMLYGGAGYFDSFYGGIGGGGGARGSDDLYGSPSTTGKGGEVGGRGSFGNNGRGGGGGSGIGGGGGSGSGVAGLSGGTAGIPGYGGSVFVMYSNSLAISASAYIHCNGTDAAASVGESAGSGGGGGGLVAFGYHSLVENNGVLEALGGAGSLSASTQGDGAAGGDGYAGVVRIPLTA